MCRPGARIDFRAGSAVFQCGQVSRVPSNSTEYSVLRLVRIESRVHGARLREMVRTCYDRCLVLLGCGGNPRCRCWARDSAGRGEPPYSRGGELDSQRSTWPIWRRFPRTIERWAKVLAVYVVEKGIATQAIAASTRSIRTTLRFTPRYSLRPGMRYRAYFDRWFSCSRSLQITKEISIPAPPAGAAHARHGHLSLGQYAAR